MKEVKMSTAYVRKWFLFGFVLTGMVAIGLLAIVFAPRGLAQDQTEPESFSNLPALEQGLADDNTLAGEAASVALAEAVAQYSSPLTIPAADFTSDGIFPDQIRFVVLEDNRGGYFRGLNSPDACLMAPAYLPDGAAITNLTATVVDSDSINRIIVSLYRSSRTTGSVNTLATVSTSTGSSSQALQDISTTSISNGVVDNTNYTYYVTTCLPAATIHLYSVRIFYAP
jgi:hypothetical protein